MTQWMKVLAIKPAGLSWLFWTNVVGENLLTLVL